MPKKNKKTKKKQIKIIGVVVSLLLIFFSLLFDVFLCVVDVLPFKYLSIILVGTNLFVLLFVIFMVKRKFKIWLKFVSIFFSILMIFVFIVGCIYINKTYDFMGKIKARETVTENYYVIVNKDSSYGDIKDLDNQVIGTFDEKIEIYDKAIELLKEKAKIELKYYDAITDMANDLLSEEVDPIYLSSYHEGILNEELNGFADLTKVLETIESEVPNTSIIEHSKVDVVNETFTIYVSGIDQYGDISVRSRSDVNMLVTVNPKNHEILLTSIPRDYYVQLHDTTGYKDKLTHAGIYGVNMSVNTIEDLLGIDIDYYFRVNFSTLVKVVDTIGGIDVYSDKSFRPWTNQSIYINEGTVHMDGATALAFARERYTYKEGDRHRVQNQQDVITAIIKKLTSSTTLLTKYTTLLDQLSSSFETNIDLNSIKPLIKMQLDKMPSWTIKKYSLNGSDAMNYTYSAGMQQLYVMIPDENTVTQASEYIKAMENGKTLEEIGL